MKIKGVVNLKKLFLGLSLSTALLLAACGTDDTGTTEEGTTEDPTEETTGDTAQEGGLQDGTYRIEDTNFGETGWKESLEIVVEEGQIADANWSSVDEEGNEKIEDEEYQETMSGIAGVGPQDYIPELEGQLVETQDPGTVEVVTGATSTSEKFVDYSQQLVDAAEEGNTETIEVDNQD